MKLEAAYHDERGGHTFAFDEVDADTYVSPMLYADEDFTGWRWTLGHYALEGANEHLGIWEDWHQLGNVAIDRLFQVLSINWPVRDA